MHAKTTRPWLRLLAACGVFVLIAAACGGDDDDDANTSATSTSTGSDSTTTAANSDDDATLTVAETALGDTLVDATGKTLYVFDNDAADTSVCTGQCESVWPPLTVTGDVVVGGGLDEEDLRNLRSRRRRDAGDGVRPSAVHVQWRHCRRGDERAGRRRDLVGGRCRRSQDRRGECRLRSVVGRTDRGFDRRLLGRARVEGVDGPAQPRVDVLDRDSQYPPVRTRRVRSMRANAADRFRWWSAPHRLRDRAARGARPT